MQIATNMVSNYINNLFMANNINEEKSKTNNSHKVKSDIKKSKTKDVKSSNDKVNKPNSHRTKENARNEKNVCPVKVVPTSSDKKVDIKIDQVKKTEDYITAKIRKTCPVRVFPTVKSDKSLFNKQEDTKKEQSVESNIKKINDVKEEEHRLYHFVQHLRELKVNHTPPMRMPTGLYELDIIQNNGNPVKISTDISGLLYSDDIKFFLGHINPGDEYSNPAIMMTKNSINSIINGVNISEKYIINESLFNLNKVLDLQTLKEKDKTKRSKVFELAAKAISDPDIYQGILKASGNEAFRFAFCRYMNEKEFSIVSSKRNLSSNLTDDKLLVTKEIWINIKGNNVQLITKECK